MCKKLLSVGLTALLLVSMLCVGELGVSAAAVTGGTMTELTTAEQTAALGKVSSPERPPSCPTAPPAPIWKRSPTGSAILFTAPAGQPSNLRGLSTAQRH